MMHSTIRLAILRSGHWNPHRGAPISTLATSGGVYAFGTYRAEIIKAFGANPSQEELDSWIHMWQYVTRLQGGAPDLLREDLAEQHRIDSLVLSLLNRPGPESVTLTAANFAGLARMRERSRIRAAAYPSGAASAPARGGSAGLR